MTELRVVGHRLLVLHFDDLSCAIIASELAAIDHDGAGARITVDGPLRELSEYLPGCSSSAPVSWPRHRGSRCWGGRWPRHLG